MHSTKRKYEYHYSALDYTAYLQFYLKQEILDEDEFTKFEEVLKTPLPLSFRVLKSSHLASIQRFLSSYEKREKSDFLYCEFPSVYLKTTYVFPNLTNPSLKKKSFF